MHLFLKLKHKESRTYQVVIKTMENRDGLIENELSYNCSFSLKGESLNGYIINIKRSDVLLNGTNEQSPVSELLLIVGEILSDLDLEISHYGKILKIKNYPAVLKKWEVIKFKIENSFKGEIVSKILSPMDNTLQNRDTIIASLSKDIFFFNCIMGIYGEYTNGRNDYEGLFWGMSDMPLKIMKQNKLSSDDMDNIHVEFSIKIMPESLEQWQTRLIKSRGSGILDATIKGNYHFRSNDYIRSIDSCFEAHWNHQLFKRIIVTINLKEE